LWDGEAPGDFAGGQAVRLVLCEEPKCVKLRRLGQGGKAEEGFLYPYFQITRNIDKGNKFGLQRLQGLMQFSFVAHSANRTACSRRNRSGAFA